MIHQRLLALPVQETLPRIFGRAELRRLKRRRLICQNNFGLLSACHHRSISTTRASHRIRKIQDILLNRSTQDQVNEESSEIAIGGIVRSVRAQKRVVFANVNDGSNMDGLQIVLDPVLGESLRPGCSVKLRGNLVKSKGKGQDYEMSVNSIDHLGECDQISYPFQKHHQIDLSLQRRMAHLRPRLGSVAALFRLRSMMIRILHETLFKMGMIQVHTPLITSSDCEGAGEMFTITPQTREPTSSTEETTNNEHFFGKQANLTVSSQLHLEALSAGLGDVYTLSPVFRAEKSSTHRHLAEFYMLEVEMGHVDTLEEVMECVEDAVKNILRGVVNDNIKDDLNLSSVSSSTIQQMISSGDANKEKRWTRISYTEAIEILQQQEEQEQQQRNTRKFTHVPTWGLSLQSEHEKWLAGEYFKGPVFVYDYPASIKPFYMRRSTNTTATTNKEQRDTVSCFDLLVPEIGELAGGSLREERYDVLAARMRELDMSLDSDEWQWYLDLRRYGTIKHGGFGLGWDRFVGWVSQTDNLKEVAAFPRVCGSGVNFVG